MTTKTRHAREALIGCIRLVQRAAVALNTKRQHAVAPPIEYVRHVQFVQFAFSRTQRVMNQQSQFGVACGL